MPYQSGQKFKKNATFISAAFSGQVVSPSMLRQDRRVAGVDTAQEMNGKLSKKILLPSKNSSDNLLNLLTASAHSNPVFGLENKAGGTNLTEKNGANMAKTCERVGAAMTRDALKRTKDTKKNNLDCTTYSDQEVNAKKSRSNAVLEVVDIKALLGIFESDASQERSAVITHDDFKSMILKIGREKYLAGITCVPIAHERNICSAGRLLLSPNTIFGPFINNDTTLTFFVVNCEGGKCLFYTSNRMKKGIPCLKNKEFVVISGQNYKIANQSKILDAEIMVLLAY